MKFECNVRYILPIGDLKLDVGGVVLDVSEILRNGRVSYLIFEEIVRRIFGLDKGIRGSDHSFNGSGIEQKAFSCNKEFFHIAASCTFNANNKGPAIKSALAKGDYDLALEICKETGFNKNDFYVLTSTSQYAVGSPIDIIFLRKEDVLRNLDGADPRRMSVASLYRLVERIENVEVADAAKIM